MHRVEHLFVLMRAGDGEDLRVMLADVIRLGAQAAGDDHAAVCRQGFADGVEAFGFGAIEEAAGVDDHRVRSGVIGRDGVAFGAQAGQDALAVDQGFGTTKADHADAGLAVAGGFADFGARGEIGAEVRGILAHIRRYRRWVGLGKAGLCGGRGESIHNGKGILVMIEVRRLSLDEVVGDVPLNAAETRLITACKAGEMAWFGDELPTAGIPQNIIRAALIRHIILGGCGEVPVGPKGVRIKGAWITDVLDLQGCDSPLDLFLWDCYICETPVLMDARLGSVMLPGCMVPGLNAHRLKVVRNVQLHQDFKSNGAVDLGGAQIAGQLACNGGRFDGAGGVALNCDAMTVGADVFLHNGFEATGQVNLRGAQITGQLACDGGTFDEAGGVAMDCEAMTVGVSVFFARRVCCHGAGGFGAGAD